MSKRLTDEQKTRQLEIKERRASLERELRKARGEVEIVLGKMRALEGECDHPRLYKTWTQKEYTDVCPDCGYSY